MELLQHDLPPSHDLVVWGDTHHGSLASSSSTVKEIVQRVGENKTTYTAHLGDCIEAKLVDSPHFSAEVHDARKIPSIQVAEFCEMVKPIKRSQWLGINRGNHEYKHLRTADLTGDICRTLGAPYAGFTARHTVRDKKTGFVMYRMLTTHGKKLANSTAPSPLTREKIMQGQVQRSLAVLGHADCSLNFCGHGHKLIIVPPMHEPYFADNGESLVGHYTKFRQDDTWIDENLRWFGMCGTQHRTAIIGGMTYSEMSGYGPAMLGYILVKVRDRKITNVEAVHLGHV